MRRPGHLLRGTLCIANLEFDTGNRQASINNEPQLLSARETAVLELLMRSKGRVVSKKQVEDHIFGHCNDIASNAVEVYVHRLRRRLAEKGAKVEVHTIRGVGYLLRGEVTRDRLEGAGRAYWRMYSQSRCRREGELRDFIGGRISRNGRDLERENKPVGVDLSRAPKSSALPSCCRWLRSDEAWECRAYRRSPSRTYRRSRRIAPVTPEMQRGHFGTLPLGRASFGESWVLPP
jgi:DNA-binding winged helix-turn-helix (wHTH) protein